MSLSNEAMGAGSDGAILNFYAELPSGADDIGIDEALEELDMNIRGLGEPAVATIFRASPEPSEDYRRFYVEFEPHATQQNMVAALGLVARAIQRFRQ